MAPAEMEAVRRLTDLMEGCLERLREKRRGEAVRDAPAGHDGVAAVALTTVAVLSALLHELQLRAARRFSNRAEKRSL